jgi:hypothetical protein
MHIKNAARSAKVIMPAGLRRAAILPVACLALSAASFIAPTAASAATLPVACNGDGCFSLASIYGTFNVWAQSVAFYGHFELQTPEHTTSNTKNEQWAVGQTRQILEGEVNGRYCMTAWQLQGSSSYREVASICMTITQIK